MSLIIPAGYIGDVKSANSVRIKFTSINTSGVPTQLAGTPAISVYKDDSTTQTTTGVTLTVDFDGITGLNQVDIDLTDAFYTEITDFHVVITTGTVGGSSVVGYVVAHFSIFGRFVDIGSINQSTDYISVLNDVLSDYSSDGVIGPNLGIRINAIQASSANTITLDASADATDDVYNNYLVIIFDDDDLTVKESAFITDYVGSTKVATLDHNFGIFTPVSGDTFVIYGFRSSGTVDANVVKWGGSTAAVVTNGSLPAVTVAYADQVGKMSILSIANGVADSGTTTTLVDSDRLESGTDYWAGDFIVIYDGTGIDGEANQTRLITGFDPVTDTITFTPAVTNAVSSGFLYYILPAARVDVGLWNGSIQTVDVIEEIFVTDAITVKNSFADALLKRDWTQVAGEAARSVLNSLRFLRNRRSIVAGVLQVTGENDVDIKWSANLTTSATAEPITDIDPT